MSASWWLRCSSFLFPFFYNKLDIHPQTKAPCWVLGWAAEPAEPPNRHQPCPDPCCCGWGKPRRMPTCVATHTRDRRCRSPVFPREASSIPLEQTKHKKQNNLSLAAAEVALRESFPGPGPQDNTAGDWSGTLGQPLPRGGGRGAGALATPAVWDAAADFHCSPARPTGLRLGVHTWGKEGDWERGE